MSDRPPKPNPNGGGLPPEVLGDDIPDAVLDELLVAFADRDAPRPQPATPPAGATPAAGASAATDTPDPSTDASPALASGTPAPSRPTTVITDVGADANATPVAEPPVAPPRDEAVVVIEADDLPDAVVLDGDPSTGGFDGDGSGAVKRPGVDPRFRARRIAVRRAEGRKRLRWFVIGAGIVLVVVGVLAVLASPLFAIDKVDVEGVVYADPAAVQAVVDSLEGDPILTADLDGAARKLEQIPWVEAARVTMHFPNKVSIEIAERTPVASFKGADAQFRVVDADAFVVAVLPNQPLDYPPITGVLPNSAAGSGAGANVKGASQLIAALPPTIADRLESVELGPTGDLIAHLGGVDGGPPLTIKFGPPNDYRDKLVAVLARMSQQPAGYTEIDVTTGDAITK